MSTHSRLSPLDGLRAALPDGGFGDFDLSGADRTGVPAVNADFAAAGWPREHAFGYGTNHRQACIGAYGELVEAVLLHQALQDAQPRRASHSELVKTTGSRAVVDPLTLALPAGTTYHPDQPRHWLTATRWRTGEHVLVPAEFCGSQSADIAWQPRDEQLITVITNGSGAGDSTARAVSHGLLELLQRHGNTTAFRAMDAGVVIDLDAVTDHDTIAILGQLRSVGIEPMAKLASTEFGIPVVHVVAADEDPATPPLAATACGEAAHPDRHAALRKAVLEYAAARVRKIFSHSPLDQIRHLAPANYWAREFAENSPAQEPRAMAAMLEWSTRTAAQLTDLLRPVVLAQHSTVAFSALPTVAPGSLDDPEALLTDLLERLTDLDVLVVLAEAGPAVAAKVIVPGLEAETMSYGRIGERGVARLLSRHTDHGMLAGLGDPPHPGAAPVALTVGARERLGGPAWLDLAAVDAVVGNLYPLYREPGRHALARAAG